MKKQELLHLHGVLAEVVDYCKTLDGMSIDLDDHEELNTRPTSIHQSKTAHKDAVFVLTNAITGELQAEGAGTISASTD